MPARYSRHYYDLYCYEKSQYKESAFRQPDLLERVVTFINKFYRCRGLNTRKQSREI